ncbi:AAA family ATPase [Pseudomonas corrugata]|uniref:AAA family ATPase n=1 Tax=Pseudomonas corrugata TaxID=47879 RepID=UPI003EDAB96E
MIIDFCITNFRSFRDPTLLSMSVENPKAHLMENISCPRDQKFGVLRTAGIYGANASGKSNILLALRALEWLIEKSGDLKEDEKIWCYEPYALSNEHKGQPISFEIEFLGPDELRYLYAISFNRNEILTESLSFYPSRQKANIFERSQGDTWEDIRFFSHYKGGFKRFPFFKNNSYLSKAGNNASAPDIVRRVYTYFRTILNFGFNEELYESQVYEDDSLLAKAAALLGKLDTGIVGITKKENSIDKFNYFPDGIPEEVKENYIKRRKYEFIFSHTNDHGERVSFVRDDESDGTKKLFSILPAIITTLELGTVLVMDELDTSFHPHIAETIVKLFNNSETNKYDAQLIFTTHNISLMSSSCFRRDQIWFTEKVNGASSLYCLDEFDKGTVKSNSPFGYWYEEGRFGAVPTLNFAEIAEIISRDKDFLELPTKPALTDESDA